MFIRNSWYVAAFVTDLAPGDRLGRTFLGDPVVLFRTETGAIAALEDRCSHRAMPLSEGQVDGEHIRCCYHGVEFDMRGACTHIPNQQRVSAAANIRAYPVAEKDGLIWIWMGDPALADRTIIVDNPEHEDPRWAWKSFSFHVKANWQLLVDNIMDLTHVPYIHARTIGGDPEQHYSAQTAVEFDGRKITLLRQLPNSIPPRSYVDAGGFTGRVDRWQEVRFDPARGMTLRAFSGGCEVDTGAYDGRRDHGIMFANNHFVTPETETSTHYLWTICTNVAAERGVHGALFDQFHTTISEDEATLELQQARIDDDPSRPFVGIASDGAVNQARRLLGALHDAEAEAVVAAE